MEKASAPGPGVFGSLLLRTVLYSSIGGICLFGWHRVSHLLLPFGVVTTGFVLGIPLWLLLMWDAVPTYLIWRRAAKLRALAEQGSIVVPGYFRLTPYTSNRSDRKRYQREDRKHEAVLAWMMANEEPVSYLSGRSGTGKSSLLDAYVLPELAETAEAWRIITIASGTDALAHLEQALLEPGRVWEHPPQALKGVRLLLARACGDEPSPFLIVLDHFEEFLLTREFDPARLEAFCQFVRHMTENGPNNLKFLLVFRTDYLPSVFDLNLPTPIPGKNWHEVSPFLPLAARNFLKGSDPTLSDHLLNRFLHEIYEIEETRGLVRPITLNMIGQVLASSPKYDWAHLDYEHGMYAMLNEYFRKTLANPLIRRYTIRILKPMLTADGTKRECYLEGLADESGVRKDVLHGALIFLANHSLVRCLDPLLGKWAIAHDYVAKQLDLILRRTKFDQARQWRRWVFVSGLLAWSLGLFVVLPEVQTSLRNRTLAAIVRSGGEVSEDEKGLAVRFRSHPRLDQTTPFLADLPSLYKLDLSGTPVTDLMALKELSQLRVLNLSGAANADLRTLDAIDQLQQLNLSHLPIKDVNGIQALKGLVALDLSSSMVEHLSSLASFPSLARLSLRGTSIRTKKVEQTDFDFTTMSLQELMTVEVTPENVPFLTELAAMPNLTALDLSSTYLTGLEPLADMPKLNFLLLADTRVEDLTPLASLTGLTHLDLSRTQITSLAALKDMSVLATLRLSQTKIKDLQPLAELRSLHKLHLERTNVIDLSPLTRLNHLESLNLAYTLVSDLSPIENLSEIRDLDIRGTSIMALEDAAYLPSLERLVVADTGISDLTILQRAANLRILDISRTAVTSLAPLFELRDLHILVLVDTTISLDELKNLRRHKPGLKLISNNDFEK